MSRAISFTFTLALTASLTFSATSVLAADSDDVRVGGWLGFIVADDDKTGSKPYFDAHPWYLTIQSEPVEDWRFLGEIEAEHVFKFKGESDGTTSGTGELKLERLYIEHEFDTAAQVRVGKFYLPFGYWYALHWHFLTETLSRPFAFSDSHTPKFQVGVQFWGRLFLTDATQLTYYAWVGDGPDQFGTNKRTVKQPGYGASVFVTHDVAGDFSIGLAGAYHHQRLDATTRENEDSFVGGIEIKHRYADLRTEYYSQLHSQSRDLSSYYASAVIYPLVPWELDQVGLVYRLDGGDDTKHAGGAIDPGAIAHSIGALWRPHARVLLKGEYRHYEFDADELESLAEWNLFIALKY